MFLCFVVAAASCSGSTSISENSVSSSDAAETAEAAPPAAADADAEPDGDTPAEGATDSSLDADTVPVDDAQQRVALLLQQCEAGSDIACDVLIMNTEEDSPEEAIALRCGGRSDDRVLFCTAGFEHKGRNYWFEEDSEGLPGMVTLCEDGDMTACDFLFERSAVGSEYEAIGDGCNFRIDVAVPDCRTQFAEEFGRCPSDLPGGCDES